MPLNIDFQQVLLHALNFVILFGALYFLLYNPVKKFMDHRNDELEKLLKDAADTKTEGEQLKEEYQQKLSTLESEMQQKRLETLEVAEQQAAGIIGKAREDAGIILRDARERGKNEQEAVLRSARRTVNELAQEAVARLLIEDSEDSYNCFLDKVEQNRG